MAFNPGRTVGRVSIRVVPDTKGFRREAQNELDMETRGLDVEVNITGVNVDRVKVRADLERQMKTLNGVNVDLNAAVKVDEVRLRKASIRASLQRQFDQLKDVKVGISAHIKNVKQFEHDVKHMVNKASRNQVNIKADAHTLDAAAQMKWLSRDRIVNLIPKVSASAATSALTALTALSGMRLSKTWMEDLKDFAKNLDKSLPSMIGWTTAISGLTAALFAGTAEVVAFGQGLVAMAPALLVVPGIIMNAGASVTTLFMAIRDTKTELASLKPLMTELGDIMSTGVWSRARQPIIDLVTGLMPQLRNAFTDLSAGIGDFTASLSNELAKDLAGGRMESIFKGIADGWRVLAVGADGIAGSLVNLSQIGAMYTPRLAAWFTRQAQTFSNWMDRITETGRVEVLMQGAIDSMYDFWDATKGAAGILEGLYRAADKADAGGLKGLAHTMERWDKAVNSAGAQKGLAIMFRGAQDAMEELGNGVDRFARMVGGLAPVLSRVMVSTAGFAGGVVAGLSDALNSSRVRVGLNELAGGLDTALQKIQPALTPLANVTGDFLGALGNMAQTILPAAVNTVAAFTPALSAVIDAINPVLGPMSNATTQIANLLAPAVTSLVTALSPALQGVMLGLADALVAFAPAVKEALGGLTDMLNGLNDWSKANKGMFDGLTMSMTADEDKWYESIRQMTGDQLRTESGFVLKIPTELTNPANVDSVSDAIGLRVKEVVASQGAPAGRDFLRNLTNVGLPPEIMAELESRWGPGFQLAMNNVGAVGSQGLNIGFGEGLNTMSTDWFTAHMNPVASNLQGLMPGYGITAGGMLASGLTTGFDQNSASIPTIISGRIKSGLSPLSQEAGQWLTDPGVRAGDGFTAGVKTGTDKAKQNVSGLPGELAGNMASLYGVMSGVGANGGQGIADGISSKRGAIAQAGAAAARAAVTAAKQELDIHSPSRVGRREIGQMWGAGVALGISDSEKAIRDANRGLVDPDDVNGPNGGGSADGTAAQRVVNLSIHNPVVRDVRQEAWEAAQLVGEGVL